MADIYQAYQEYLNNIGEYVPSASDVYSGVAGLTSRVPQVARDVLLPSDSGDGGISGGPGGTGGIGDLLDQYNNASFLERGLVNTGIGLAFPQAAGLLGMYNVGKGIYDFGRGVLGYNEQPTTMGYDFYGDLGGGIADPSTGSFSTNPGIGFSNTDGDIESDPAAEAQQAAIESEMSVDYGGGESSGGAGTGNSNASEPGGSDSMGSF